jgi:hypothetical protein
VRVFPFDSATRTFTAQPLDTAGCQAKEWVGTLPRPLPPAGLDLVVRASCPVPGSATPTEAVLVLSALASATPARMDLAGMGAAALADVDGDQQEEVLFARTGQAALHSLERAGAGFSAGPSVALPAVPTSVAVADFDADGRADVAVADGSRVMVLRNREGSLEGTSAWTRENTSGRHLLARDVDGDDRPDLAWVDGNQVRVARNGGAFSFREVPVPTGRTGEPLSLSAADVDQDGDVDLAATYPDGAEGSATVVLLNGVR